MLATWTRSVADTLSPGERELFWFLCCLEEPDRERHVLDANWFGMRWRLAHGLWRLRYLARTPQLDHALPAITASGLVSIQGEASDRRATYLVHPGVAEAGRDHAGKRFRNAVDTEVAAYWDAEYKLASEEAGDWSVDSDLAMRAGLAAVPYMLRQHEWEEAAYLLEGAFLMEPSRARAAVLLPAIEQISRHCHGMAELLARVAAVADPATAASRLRAAMAAAARGDNRAAAVVAGELINLYQESGRLAEALDLAEWKGATRQASPGPWTELADEVRRLQVLLTMGYARQVFDETRRLGEHMATLPATPGEDEAIPAWHAREGLLATGSEAARLLGRHDDVLAFNAEGPRHEHRRGPVQRL